MKTFTVFIYCGDFQCTLKFFFIEKNLVKLQDVYKDLSITERSKVNKNKQNVKSVPQYI